MGIMLYNDYGKRPWSESMLKELTFLFRIISGFLKHGRRIPFVLCYPQLPSKKTTIAKICKSKGWIITNNPRFKTEIKIYWHDSSLDETQYNSITPDFINYRCTNILKAKVDEDFFSVFGYKTALDPLTHNGIAVEKSEFNAKHNGVIINCPIQQDQVKNDCIYQILLDNKISEDLYQDLRMPVIGGKFPFVYCKTKSSKKRFEAAPDKAILHEVEDYFDEEFLLKTAAFCREAGLDFGEMDILYNNSDQRFYIIDINKTPYGPPANLSQADAMKAINLLANTMGNIYKGK